MFRESEFERVVYNNQRWLLRYVAKIAGSLHAAEDIVQETFLRAFRAYDSYDDMGRERQWLRVIARNAAARYLRDPATKGFPCEGAYGASGDEYPILGEELIDTQPSVEEQIVANELRRNVFEAVGKLPEAQRAVVYCRYVKDLDIQQTARMTGQPLGSVKSKSHYGLQRVRRSLMQSVTREEVKMDCKQVYAYLFQYASGQIVPEDREGVESHLSVCESCNGLAASLTVLTQHLRPAEEREVRHYMVSVPLEEGLALHYSGMTFHMTDYERMNALLKQRNGVIPPDENWFGTGHDSDYEHIAEFDNEGHRIEFELVPNSSFAGNVRVKYRKMVRVYPKHMMNSVGLRRERLFAPQVEDPDLMLGRLQNSLGCNAKSGLYLAIPSPATNIRIRRGNGVIDAGDFAFAFSERYVTEDETLRLECTYLAR